MKPSIKKATGFLLLLFILFVRDPATASGGIIKSKTGREDMTQRQTDVMKILWVLEMKTGDQKLLEKAKDKLFTLKNSQFSLITSLSDQVARDGDKPGGDIAFLLMAALIILS